MSTATRPLRNPGPLIIGSIFVAAGLAFIMAARGYASGSALRMGPGYFPTLVASLLVIVGLLNIASSFREAAGEGVLRIDWRPLLVVSASVAAFSVLIVTTGMVPAIAGLILISLFATRRPSWRETLALIAVVEVICITIFHLLLGLQVELVRL
jgi:hypothetical protein